MSRPRNDENDHLPRHVSIRNGAYHYRRDGKSARLCGFDEGEGAMHLALAKLHGVKVDAVKAAVEDAFTMPDFIHRAFPAISATVSERTRVNYRYTANELAATFPLVLVSDLEPADVFELRRKLETRPAHFNKLLTMLSSMMDWAVEKKFVKVNPCLSVKRWKAPKRRRYITPAERAAIYAVANPRTQVIMDLCYMTGQRIRDVLAIRESHLTADGIIFVPSKTKKHGKRICIAWSPELQEVVARARLLTIRVGGDGDPVQFVNAEQYAAAVGTVPMHDGYLLRGRSPHKPLAYQSVWDAWAAAVEAAGIEGVRLHDLRAASATDLARQHGEMGKFKANAMLCHSTMKQTETYLRDRVADVVSGPRSA